MAGSQSNGGKFVGVLLLGAVVLVGALVITSQFGADAQLCNSAVGQIGQAFSSRMFNDCQAATDAVAVASFMLLAGPVLMLIGVLGLISLWRRGGSSGGWKNSDRRK